MNCTKHLPHAWPAAGTQDFSGLLTHSVASGNESRDAVPRPPSPRVWGTLLLHLGGCTV